MRLVDNWVQLADDKGVVPNIAVVDDDVFESAILSRLELEAKSKESDLYEALMEEQAALNFLACVTTMSGVQTMQKPKMPEHVQHYAANRHGFLHVNDVPIECEVLMDSGASHASYMSESFYVQNLHKLAPYTMKTKSSVYMGDKVTKATIDKLVRMPLTLIGDSGEEYTATVDMRVLPGKGKDAIIGMPSLIIDYGYLYLDLMTEAV